LQSEECGCLVPPEEARRITNWDEKHGEPFWTYHSGSVLNFKIIEIVIIV